MEKKQLVLNNERDIMLRKIYYVTEDLLEDIKDNYMKLYKIMEIVKNHKPKVRKYMYKKGGHYADGQEGGTWICLDTEIRQELEEVLE